MAKITIGTVLFLVGLIVVPGSMVYWVIMEDEDDLRFTGPGEVAVDVDEPARYYLWHDHVTVFEGVTYNYPAELPTGMSIIVTDESGEPQEFDTMTSMSSSSGSEESGSIGYVDFEEAGAYTLSLDNLSEPRVFSFGRSVFLENVVMFFAVIAVSVLVGVLGFAVFIWGLVSLLTNRKRT